jgi:aminoglycoside 3-N-acetyltransferase
MIGLSQSLKSSIKGRLKRIRLRYQRWRHRFDTEDFVSALRRLGVEQGGVILVHSTMTAFECYTGKPTEIITALQRVIGHEGALMMPTMPFSGTAVEYALAGRTFDVEKTPSRMGIISELFRRSPGVIRSLHPTHPVAVWGSRAESMIHEHYKCKTPCGRDSPYGRLLDNQGKILLLGTGINVLTFFHTIEEILEAKMPFSPFTAQAYTLTSRLGSGDTVTTETRLFDTRISKKRNLTKMIPFLKAQGFWRETRIGASTAVLLGAADILDTVSEMGEKGIYCYDS